MTDTIAESALAMTCYKIATKRNNLYLSRAGIFRHGDLTMRKFEVVVSAMLAVATQALVVGAIFAA